MQPTTEIKLNAKLTLIIKELQNGLNEARQKYESLNLRLNDILTGVCLNENIDTENTMLSLNEDCTTLTSVSKPKPESETPSPTKTSIKKNIK